MSPCGSNEMLCAYRNGVCTGCGRVKPWYRIRLDDLNLELDYAADLANRQTDKIMALEKQLDKHEEQARVFWGFQQAYPTDLFPEVENWDEVNAALEAKGLSLTRVSASNMRHVTRCITEALTEGKDEG